MEFIGSIKYKNIRIILILFLSTLIFAYLAFSMFLAPGKRAVHHLDFIHNAIAEMHPAILEEDASEFSNWHQQGYLETKQLLPMVNSDAAISDFINFYLSGYQDQHLISWVNHSPYSILTGEPAYWAGFLLKANQRDYVVIHRLDSKEYPPLGATIISCDGETIDALLRNRYAPFIDRRWNILNAREKSAKALSLNRSRASFDSCIFEVDGHLHDYAIKWNLLGEKDGDRIAYLSHPVYQLPAVREFKKSHYWVVASDFSPGTDEAVNAVQILLDDLYVLENPETVVIDLRGNSGGSSFYGYAILSRLLHRDMASTGYFNNKLNEVFQDADAIIRASWKAYWSVHYKLNNDVVYKDRSSPISQHFYKYLNRMKDALDNNEPSFYQSEISAISEIVPKHASENWNSLTRFVLITDRRCISACLDMVDAMKLIPNLLHLGEPTDADTVYTEVTEVQSSYYYETFNYLVPIKKWNRRFREDNQPYIPDVIYDGDMNDDQALQQWVEQQIGSI